MSDSAPRKAPPAAAKPAAKPAAATPPASTQPASTQAAGKQADQEQADPEQTKAAPAEAQSPATPDADGGKTEMDELKRKFREALDRKREIHAEGSGSGGRDNGKIHGAHGPAGSRRSFRRKSG